LSLTSWRTKSHLQKLCAKNTGIAQYMFIGDLCAFNVNPNNWICSCFLVSHVSRKVATLANQQVGQTFRWAGYIRTGQTLALHTLPALDGADCKTGQKSAANQGRSQITSAFMSPILAHAAPRPFRCTTAHTRPGTTTSSEFGGNRSCHLEIPCWVALMFW
jgi:hypothetical protein